MSTILPEGVNDVFDDLEAEYEALDSMLSSLTDEQWTMESLCPGWSVTDVVLHLAQTEEAIVAVFARNADQLMDRVTGGSTVDEAMDRWVASERGASPDEVFERWRAARTRSVAAMRDAPPDETFPWAAAPLRSRTAATTRLSEHWIHAQDIADGAGAPYPDTPRLWHIARLAHRTLPYAFAREGRGAAPEVNLELASPAGDTWTFGTGDAACRISGPAGDLCRVAARRKKPDDTALESAGEQCGEVLELIRTYA